MILPVLAFEVLFRCKIRSRIEYMASERDEMLKKASPWSGLTLLAIISDARKMKPLAHRHFSYALTINLVACLKPTSAMCNVSTLLSNYLPTMMHKRILQFGSPRVSACEALGICRLQIYT